MADLAALDKQLADNSYLNGSPYATKDDIAEWGKIAACPEKHPHVARWWKHVGALAKQFPRRKWPYPEKVAPEGGEKKAKTSDAANLSNVLVGAVQGKVCTRFPPEPSGYLHIGHAKAALLNFSYAQLYGGKCRVRFDDTNPTKEKAEYEDSIIEDLKTLGIAHEPITYTSDYIGELEGIMEKMIRDGNAYCDTTPADEMKELRDEGTASKFRSASVEENIKLWKEVLAGSELGQKCCVRGKIDMQCLNKCMRDPVFYRCKVDVPHHRHGLKYKAYPTYDFCCAIVDAKEGVTHALRSLEYSDRAAMYEWVLKHGSVDGKKVGCGHVELTEFSRMNFDYTVLSKRKLTILVDRGVVAGWDDPRMPTVRGIVRRGLTVTTLKEFVMTQGASRNTNSMSWDKIWALNKQEIDPVIPRYCAMEEKSLVALVMTGGPDKPVSQKQNLHPKDPSMGQKDLWTANTVYLRQEDMAVLKDGEEITLMGWGNVIVEKLKRDGETVVSATGKLNLAGEVKSTKYKVNWLPKIDSLIKVTLRELGFLFTKPTFGDGEDPLDFINPNSLIDAPGVGEPGMKALKKGDKLQLIRGGYYIVDSVDPMVLIEIPDGKAKKVSGEARTDAAWQNKEKKEDKKEEKSVPGEKKAEKGGKKDAKAAAPADVAKPLDDVSHLDIRVGKITKVWAHPEADRLWCEEIDIGESKPIQVCSGLREHYTEDKMKDRMVVLIANMKPRKMKEVESQGMVLCATGPSGVELLEPPAGAKAGERVTFSGYSGEPDAVLNEKKGKAPLPEISPLLKTNSKREAAYRDIPFMTSAGPVTVPGNASSPIG